MEFNFASRLDSFEEGIFSTLNDKKNELLRAGRKVYNMSVGTPDFKPAQHIIDAVSEAASKPENYKYALADLPELLDAVSNHYAERYGVKGIRHEEIMSIYGSQEGMAHIAMAICDPGDVVLVPNPGYPVFTAGPFLCGAKVETYDLHPENNFLIEFDKIPEEQAKRAKMMIVSYPLNPVCVTAPDSFYEELITFAKKYNIIILHDNAYSDIIYGGKVGKSFLAFEGAKEVGVEFYSLSKSYNYTGARMSFVVGNQAIIDRLAGVEDKDRTARFVCAMAAVFPDGRHFTTRGTMEGIIAHEIKGANGFGYDPIVYLPQYGKTSAELTPEEKNKISHRGEALEKLKAQLAQYLN